jgi:alkyldihydroxyacetonephosphate synthase
MDTWTTVAGAMALGILAGAIGGVIFAFVLRRPRGAAKQKLEFSYDASDGERYRHKWGFTDTEFEFVTPRVVRVTGNRYPLAGYEMHGFIPYVEEVLGITMRPEDSYTEVRQVVPAPRENPGFLTGVMAAVQPEQISQSDDDRLIHSHGQLSVDEIYRVLYTEFQGRICDLVLYPESDDDVRNIVALSIEHDVCNVPYGGGTNVSGALALPKDEDRVIVSVDMRRMNRILELDEENLTVTVQAGIEGKELELRLDELGYTSGHDPDSIELSTLGGWIATNASGMKKNRYGNIEDIVLEVTMITPSGEIETKNVTPRNSHGIQTKYLAFGSEGNFGIITKAVLKVHPRPGVREYGSLVFPSFERGVEFLRELRKRGVMPASIRLVNNYEFRFGQALKEAPKGAFRKLKSRIQKFVLLKVKRFDPRKLVACTILMEGRQSEVEHEREAVFATAKEFGGLSGGSSNGKRGYTLTFGIAYIRDFLNQFGILGETFETSVPWNKIHDVVNSVGVKLREQCKSYGVTGFPYLSYRVTQTYHTGVCIYFTMGFIGRGLDNPVGTYHDIEHSLRQTILDAGGSLSHHHGVGKIRQSFLPQRESEGSLELVRRTKVAVDPRNVFGIKNNAIGGDE